jgi:hypothetical protein
MAVRLDCFPSRNYLSKTNKASIKFSDSIQCDVLILILFNISRKFSMD